MMANEIFRDGNRLYTKNLADESYREWIPERSKMAAAILNGMKEMPITNGSIVLYLGASTGTTASHVSDIVKMEGFVYAVEFAERVFRSLLDLAKQRRNIAPILADCRKPEDYSWVEMCDAVYCDVADPQESHIAVRNANEFLKDDGYILMAIKSQSIDVTKPPQKVYKEESEKLKKAGFSILQLIELEPYEKKHAMVVARKPSQQAAS